MPALIVVWSKYVLAPASVQVPVPVLMICRFTAVAALPVVPPICPWISPLPLPVRVRSEKLAVEVTVLPVVTRTPLVKVIV